MNKPRSQSKRRSEAAISVKPSANPEPKLRRGTEVLTRGGYTATVLGPDPKDPDRILIRYSGQQAYLGEDFYPPYLLTIANLPPEVEEVGFPERQPNGGEGDAEEKGGQSCDACRFQEIEHNCSDGKAFRCSQSMITGAIFVGGVIAQSLAKTCTKFEQKPGKQASPNSDRLFADARQRHGANAARPIPLRPLPGRLTSQ